MSLTPLDQGLLRFLEFSLTLVFQEVYYADELQAATRTLLSRWPTLGARLNLLRTDLIQVPSKSDEAPNVWTGRHIDRNLEQVIDISNPKRAGSNVKQLDEYFNFGNGLKQALRGQVFQVRTVFLRNATCLRFVFQHPLCDATGGYTIARAYCNILNEKDVPDISFTRFPVQLKDEIIQEALKEKDTQEQMPPVKESRDVFIWSWRDLLKKASRLLARDLLRPSLRRVDNTLFIPAGRLQSWKEDARKQDISVTEQDLLTAFIYQSVYNASSPQDFVLVLGIRRYLQNQTPIHNSCILLPVSIDGLYDLDRLKMAPLPEIAAQVRRTIVAARKPECLSGLLEFNSHSSKRPMIPRWIGRSASQAAVTSWNDLPLFGLDARGTKPSFIHGELDLWGFMKKLRLSIDDIIISWKAKSVEEGDAGYWIRGRLTTTAWEKMAETLESSS
ncbi:hypothetical protein BDW62DRAFT_214853 [Aspergillus aurantiobrunneus]